MAGVEYRPNMDQVGVIDSHTEGEPTRVVVENGPSLEGDSVAEMAKDFRARHDTFRRAIICEPRGHDAIVGALLVEPVDSGAVAGVIFFNNVGILHMCVHGTMGVVRTLGHLGKIEKGSHLLETPVGLVTAHLGANGLVSVENVPSFRQEARVRVDVEGVGPVTGDIAWGGNWFFLSDDHGLDLASTDMEVLRERALHISWGLEASAFHGVHVDPDSGEETYHVIDHVGLFDKPTRSDCDSRNFILCPGGEYDRSPCGTGTSAKLACLHADGKLDAGETWSQESIIGSKFVGQYHESRDGTDTIIPTITGGAWITGQSTFSFDPDDPFSGGIVRR